MAQPAQPTSSALVHPPPATRVPRISSPHKRTRDELQEPPSTDSDDAADQVARQLRPDRAPPMTKSFSAPGGSGASLSAMAAGASVRQESGQAATGGSPSGNSMIRQRSVDGKPAKKKPAIQDVAAAAAQRLRDNRGPVATDLTFGEVGASARAPQGGPSVPQPARKTSFFRPASSAAAAAEPSRHAAAAKNSTLFNRTNAARPLTTGSAGPSRAPAVAKKQPPPSSSSASTLPQPSRLFHHSAGAAQPSATSNAVAPRVHQPPRPSTTPLTSPTLSHPVPPPARQPAATTQAPISTTPTSSPPRQGASNSAATTVTVSKVLINGTSARPGAAPLQAEATRTSSLGSLRGAMAETSLSGTPTPKLPSPPQPSADIEMAEFRPAPSSSRDPSTAMVVGEAPHAAPPLPARQTAKKSVLARPTPTPPPLQKTGAARKSVLHAPLSSSSTNRPAPPLAKRPSADQQRSVGGNDKRPRKEDLPSHLSDAATSLPSPAVSTSPVLERPPSTRNDSTTSNSKASTSSLSKGKSKEEPPASSTSASLDRSKKDGTSSKLRLRRVESRASSTIVATEDEDPPRDRVKIKKKLDKGKGKARTPPPSTLSSSDDTEEETVVSRAPRRAAPALNDPRRPQAWEEPDPEDYIAGALHPKRFIVTISAITLLAMDLTVESIAGVKITVTLRDASTARDSSSLASTSLDHLSFKRAPSTSNSRLATATCHPIDLSLLFNPSLHRSVSSLVIDVHFIWGSSSFTTSALLTRPSGGFILCRPPTLAVFEGQADAIGPHIAWSTELVGGGRALSVEEGIEETERKLRRLDIDANPVWLPDGKPKNSQKHVKMPGLSDDRRGYDQLTKHHYVPGQKVSELYNIDTPATAAPAVARFDRDIRRADLTPKQRLIFQLHHRWCALHPFAKIVDREIECWTWFASTVHHFDARLELAEYLNDQLVLRDSHPPLKRVEMRNEGQPDAEVNGKSYAGRLSIEEWFKVMAAYEKAVKSIGPGQSYEELRSAASRRRDKPRV